MHDQITTILKRIWGKYLWRDLAIIVSGIIFGIAHVLKFGKAKAFSQLLRLQYRCPYFIFSFRWLISYRKQKTTSLTIQHVYSLMAVKKNQSLQKKIYVLKQESSSKVRRYCCSLAFTIIYDYCIFLNLIQ